MSEPADMPPAEPSAGLEAATPTTNGPAVAAVAETRPPESLPPVQPPSAGFIMQLFLIPAIIVGAVIGVWVLFGSVAGAPQDWRTLVEDLGSKNEHRRWRAASGLAHMLNADRQRFDSLGQLKDGAAGDPALETPLARNPSVADELIKLFDEQIGKRSVDEEDVTHQEFLARTLGALDLPDQVLPSLRNAATGDHDVKVRASSLTSIAQVVFRASARSEEIEDQGKLVEDLMMTASDTDAFLRQISAYTLGLVPTEEAIAHLTTMLADADEKTRVNAAVALARNGHADGVSVFAEVIRAASEVPADGGTAEERQKREVRYEAEIPAMLNATLQALKDLVPKLTAKQSAELASGLGPIAKGYMSPKLRSDARKLVKQLGG